MSSKVYSAKRDTVKITYEFADGSQNQLIVCSISTKEGKELSAIVKNEDATMADFFEKLVPLHLQKNDSKIVKKVMNEQLNEGDIIKFGKSLSEAIEDAKKEKGND
jgi:aromatic ring-opening dioxygenase LigB subunit